MSQLKKLNLLLHLLHIISNFYDKLINILKESLEKMEKDMIEFNKK